MSDVNESKQMNSIDPLTTITIYESDVYRAKVTPNLDDMFFQEVYTKAKQVCKELMDDISLYKKENPDEEDDPDFSKMGNNIIAFCGARGEGKTSALRSFAEFLKKGDGICIFTKGYYSGNGGEGQGEVD